MKTTMTKLRRIQIAILGYGLLLLSPQFGDSGILTHLAAIAGCLGFLLMALQAAVPGTARQSHEPKLRRGFQSMRLRLSTPSVQG
jgi:hypothetical protein